MWAFSAAFLMPSATCGQNNSSRCLLVHFSLHLNCGILDSFFFRSYPALRRNCKRSGARLWWSTVLGFLGGVLLELLALAPASLGEVVMLLSSIFSGSWAITTNNKIFHQVCELQHHEAKGKAGRKQRKSRKDLGRPSNCCQVLRNAKKQLRAKNLLGD